MGYTGTVVTFCHVDRAKDDFRWFRHPSYAGFFYWALGTQLVLQNPVSFVFYAAVLYKFFSRRIRGTLSVMLSNGQELTVHIVQRRKYCSCGSSEMTTASTNSLWAP